MALSSMERAPDDLSCPPASAGFLPDLLFHTEDGGEMLLRNLWLSQSHRKLQFRITSVKMSNRT
jgi:hypothetical protein